MPMGGKAKVYEGLGRLRRGGFHYEEQLPGRVPWSCVKNSCPCPRVDTGRERERAGLTRLIDTNVDQPLLAAADRDFLAVLACRTIPIPPTANSKTPPSYHHDRRRPSFRSAAAAASAITSQKRRAPSFGSAAPLRNPPRPTRLASPVAPLQPGASGRTQPPPPAQLV